MSCIRTPGKKVDAIPTWPTHRAGAPGTLWVKRKGKGRYANDRPPILSLISRSSHKVRYWVLGHADKPTTSTIIEAHVPRGSTILYTDEASNYPNVHPRYASVCHSMKEWARDDDGDGVREVDCNSCEGAGTGLCTFLRTFRGVHKYYLADYVATYETIPGFVRPNSPAGTHHAENREVYARRQTV